ncbi:major centromere autoantigen B-like [Melanaphis sacchari]|uniref:major centromere autoantigen B-like n=1 Tax=Melanaphis sacchari TaxID=742174 RepID=UPI000DC15573|nr:major centromere autoantigen B-like [Melanaphis sacchari]
MPNERNELLSIRAKKELLFCYDVAKLSSLSQHRAASILNISVVTLRKILKNRKEIEGQKFEKPVKKKCFCLRQKQKNDKLLIDMEMGMVQWFEYARSLNVRVSKMILLDKAKSLASILGVEHFSPDNNWIQKWKNKYNIADKRVQLIADQNKGTNFSATNSGLIKSVKDFFENIMSNYDANNVYSLFEIGLYYCDLRNSNCEFKGPPYKKKCQKCIHRLSIIFTSNITGTNKMYPSIIDNIHIPHYLQNVKTLSKHFQASYNTWMTSCYASILKRWDEELMGRKILVIIDNVMVDLQIELQNIKIKYLPSSIVSVHPLRQNIMRIEKTYEYYLKQTKSATMNSVNTETLATSYNTVEISVSDAIHMIFNVWENMSPALIRNCFRKVGLIKTKTEDTNENLYFNFKHWISNYRQYLRTIYNQLQSEKDQFISAQDNPQKSDMQLYTENYVDYLKLLSESSFADKNVPSYFQQDKHN